MNSENVIFVEYDLIALVQFVQARFIERVVHSSLEETALRSVTCTKILTQPRDGIFCFGNGNKVAGCS